MLSSLKLYAIIGLVLCVAGLLYHDKLGWDKLKKARVEVTQQTARADQAEVQIIAEQKARDHERQVNRQIDQQLIAANQALETERSKPLPRLRCRLQDSTGAQTNDGSTASRIDNAAGQADNGQADAGDFDPSEALMQFAIEAQQNRDGWQACQDWVRQTHQLP